MSVIKQKRIVPYTCEEMFALVNEVEKYADFMPYCVESIVHHRDIDEVKATLVIAGGGIRKSFTTHNRLQSNKMIEIRLIDGPFKHLEGFWRFDPVVEGCEVSFDMDFELSGRVFSMLLSPMFEQFTEKMIEVFCQRAKAIYDDC